MSTQETFSVSQIQRMCSLSEYLDGSDIHFNDKTITWDGSIIYFANKKPKKSGNEISIPIQIKGELHETLPNEDEISYAINVMDLENYFLNGGAIYFVVAIDNDLENPTCKVYARILLPVDINRIKSERKGEKSVSIKFRHVSSVGKLTELCKLFANNRAKQGLIITGAPPIDFTKVDAVNISSASSDKGLPAEIAVIKSTEKYLYANQGGIDIPMASTQIIAFRDDHCIITVGNDFEELYPVKHIVEEKRNVISILDLLEIIVFDDSPEKLTINYLDQPDAPMLDSFCVSKLMLAASKSSDLRINGVPVFVEGRNPMVSEMSDEFIQFQTDIVALSELMLEIGIPLDSLTLREAFEASSELQKLKFGLVNGETFILDTEEERGICLQKVGHKAFTIRFEKAADGYYSIYDFFRNSDGFLFNVTSVCPPVQISKWFMLYHAQGVHGFTIDEFIFDRQQMINELSDNPTENTVRYLNLFILSLISEYDKTRAKRTLHLAKELQRIVNDNSGASDENIINTIQISVREHDICEGDKTKLIKMKTNSDNKLLLCCICILLKQFEEYTLYYEQLSEAEKNAIITWPIMALLPNVVA